MLPRPASAHPAAGRGAAVDWAAVRRILVVRPDNLGDVLMLGPALRALRAGAPRARLDLLASPGGAAAAALLPEIDDVLVTEPLWQDAGGRLPLDPAREQELVARLAARGYGAALVFTSFSQSPWPAGYVCYLAGIPVRAGLSREFGGGVLSHWVPAPPDEQHQVDRALHLLDGVGVPPAGVGLAVSVPPLAVAAAGSALADQGVDAAAPYAVLMPGASCSSRRYAPARFAAVARLLAARGLPVAVAGSPREAGLVQEVVGGAGTGYGGAGTPRGRAGGSDGAAVVGLAGALDVPGLAGLLAGAAVAVTNNSGGMHLADALGTPLVVTFAGTELEEQYRPRTTTAVLLRVPTTCSPCRAFDCPYAHQCLDLAPARVAEAALGLARGPGAGVAAAGHRPVAAGGPA